MRASPDDGESGSRASTEYERIETGPSIEGRESLEEDEWSGEIERAADRVRWPNRPEPQ